MQDELTEISVSSSSSKSNVDCSNMSFLDFRSNTRLGEKVSGSFGAKTNGNGPFVDDTFSPNGDLFDNPSNTASLIKWSSLNNIYPILGAYGGPTFIYPTKYCLVIGTSKGPILIFSMKQFLINKLFPQQNNDGLNNDYLRSPVTSIVVSADGTHLAASYQSGDIFIWNLNALVSDTGSTGIRPDAEPLKAILHITSHRDNVINGMGFVGLRHTALMVSDNKGHLVYHNGFRSRIWSLTYSSEVVLSIAGKERLLCSETAPHVKERSSQHLVAVLTSTNFAIISTGPHLTTSFLKKIAADTIGASIANNCLSWYKDTSRVAFSVNNNVHVFAFEDVGSFNKLREFSWRATESILSLVWVNKRLLGVLTISHQFVLVDFAEDFKAVMELDLLVHDVLIPPDKHFAIRDNELYLLTHYTLKIGKLATWLDITLSHVQNGDYIGALRFFDSLLEPNVPLSSLIKLENREREKEEQLKRPFYNLALAALRFVLKQPDIDYNKVYQLLSLVIRIIGKFQQESTRVKYLHSFLEQSMEFFTDNNVGILYEVLVNYVLEGSLSVLPPIVFKGMLKHYAKEKKTTVIEELIVMLDPQMLDIDLAVRLSKEYGLFEVLVYIWNKIFNDYLTPFVDAIYKVSNRPQYCVLFKNSKLEDMEKIFDYMSFVFTGRQYPEMVPITPPEAQGEAKSTLYGTLFSGTGIEWPLNGSQKLRTKIDSLDEPAFPYFNLLLDYNPARLLSMLNEAFEDPYLNESSVNFEHENHQSSISRQSIIHVMLDVIGQNMSHNYSQISLLAIFISSNTSKYPQFIRLSNQALEKVIDALFQSHQPSLGADLQRALESVLSIYTPSDTEKFISQLREKKFNRVLFTVYTKTGRFVDLLLLALDSEDTSKDYGKDILAIVKMVLTETKDDPLAHSSVIDIVRENFCVLLKRLGPKEAALLFDAFDNELHSLVGEVIDEQVQQEYLDQLFYPLWRSHDVTQQLKNLYIEVTIRGKEKQALLRWLHEIDLKSMDAKLIVDPLLANKRYEEASVIHYRLDMFNSVLDDMIYCIRSWFQQNERQYDALDVYLRAAVDAANLSKEDKQNNWTKLLACLLNLYGSYESTSEDSKACNKAIQKLFVSLAVSDHSDREEKQRQFSNILTNALEHPEVIMRKAQELKDLLIDIFTAYNIEEHMSSIILRIIENSSADIVRDYKDAIQLGWSVQNDECEVCGKKIWGVGLNPVIFQVWEMDRRNSSVRADLEEISVVVFACRHGFHKACLENLGQKMDAFHCLLCNCKD